MGFFSSSSKKTTQKMPAWQEAEVKKMMADAGRLYDEGPVEYTDRSLNADKNQYLMQGANGLYGLNPGQGYGDAATGGLNRLGTDGRYAPQFDQAAFDAVYNNPNLKSTIDSYGTDVDRSVKAGINQNNFDAGMSGNYGTTGQVGAALLAARGMEAKNDFATGLYSNAFNQAANAGLNYGSQAASNQFNADGALASGGFQGLNTASDIYGKNLTSGLSLYGLDQAGIDREVARDNYNALAPWNTLNMYKEAAGRMGDYGGTTKESGGGPSGFQQVLGAGIAAAGMMSGNPMAAMGGLGAASGGGSMSGLNTSLINSQANGALSSMWG